MRASGNYRTRYRGYTVAELVITIFVVAIAVIVILTFLTISQPRRHTHGGTAMRDATYVRGILQGMVIWAGQNQDRYPLPSLVDVMDATVADAGPSKDTTANIFSLLIYNGSIPVDFCVSPAEVNPKITTMDGYEFKDPKRAVRPAEALWDPAFSVDFTKGTGHFSYAHRPPSGPRLKE